MNITFNELRGKDVVNMADGRKLGHILDLTLSMSGQVVGVSLPHDKSLFAATCSGRTVFLPWRCITRIGDDIILVNLGEGALPSRC
ncbi:MAG: YlmC/YmxH family sporulation protein [Clostridia bacterium]|nr:YlmC/YmxH family sporulation protein [Clostridia bacterium]